MAEVEVIVDEDNLDTFVDNLRKAKEMMLEQMAEKARILLRAEVPVATGNLKDGVGAPDVDRANMTATLTVSARSAASLGGVAEVFNSKGEPVKTVSLRPSPAFNYAEAVARGRVSISPKHGRAVLIPVTSAPIGEGYLISGGQYRRSAAAVAANPFDERAAARLDTEARSIAETALSKYFV